MAASPTARRRVDSQLSIRSCSSARVYAYSQGIGSARELARRYEYDPAFQWLTGLLEVNYHTLADFRVAKQQELDELFTQILATLSKEGLITLQQVMPDGTKIRAQARGRSFQQEQTIHGHLEHARQRVKQMGDPRNEPVSPRTIGARRRAREQQQRRLQQALAEVRKLQEQKPSSFQNAKASISDPEARCMKQSDGGLAPSYNVQISTAAAHGLIVSVEVTLEANDSAQRLPAIESIEQRLQQRPPQVIADAGYPTREAIEQMVERQIDFLGSLGRRSRIAEFPHAWIKCKLGLRQFHVLQPAAMDPPKQAPRGGRHPLTLPTRVHHEIARDPYPPFLLSPSIRLRFLHSFV